MTSAAVEKSQQAVAARSTLTSAPGIFFVLYAILLLSGERLLNDPDTYWHIAAGNWIWAHGAVPTVDPFSSSLAGAPWTAHEWFAELILAGAYKMLGWTG